MRGERLDLVFLGLSITSSWGNGHATTYRGLVRELTARGHRVLFLERDVPWYASKRDLPDPPFGRTELYGSLEELRDRFAPEIRNADLVVVGSFVPDGKAVAHWVTEEARASAFYDIDTPVTLGNLERGECEYLSEALIPRFDLYLSFTGGPTLDLLEDKYGARRALPLYCSVDTTLYYPEPAPETTWDLGYMGTYSRDRQPPLETLLLEPARRWGQGRFVVAGPLYPRDLAWPGNVHRVEHVAPAEHRAFYNGQRFTLNVTRADMIAAGYSPSVRLFEAAACGTPIISDPWPGLDSFFELGSEILVSRSPEETLAYLRELSEEERRAMGERARAKVLAEHTAARRAEELEGYAEEVLSGGQAGRPKTLESQLRNPRSPVERQIAELGPWFHNVKLPGGVQTAPDHPLGDFPSCLWLRIAPRLPADLSGWRALDVGCNAGFYTFELARRGAVVTGIDFDERYLRQARWAGEMLGLQDRASFREMEVYDLAHGEEEYDLVLFMGVFYHLRHPLLALDLLAEKTKRLMVFQTMTMPGEEVHAPTADFGIHERDLLLDDGWPKMAFIEHSLAGDPTNWWAPNRAAVEAMLRSSGLRLLDRLDTEIYLCEPDPDATRDRLTAELRSATGRRPRGH